MPNSNQELLNTYHEISIISRFWELFNERNLLGKHLSSNTFPPLCLYWLDCVLEAKRPAEAASVLRSNTCSGQQRPCLGVDPNSNNQLASGCWWSQQFTVNFLNQHRAYWELSGSTGVLILIQCEDISCSYHN